MDYRFMLGYKPTNDSGVAVQRECRPLYGDDLSVSLDMESDEWYYKRKISGTLTFVRDDYRWIMGQAFDGTFTLTVQCSTDGGGSWQDYFVGTFSRADMAIDEDNQNVIVEDLGEGDEYDVIENGRSEDYDLRKVIPDFEAREVQGQVHPALALVDYRSDKIKHSDVYCDAAITAAGYDSDHPDSGFNQNERVSSDNSWLYLGAKAECVVKMADDSSEANGLYAGDVSYGAASMDSLTHEKISVQGTLYASNGYRVDLEFTELRQPTGYTISYIMTVKDASGAQISGAQAAYNEWDSLLEQVFTPQSIIVENSGTIEKIEIIFHYIRGTLLTRSGGNADNVLDTGDYYKRMAAFNNVGGGLRIAITSNTVEQPNGHRLVPGTGERGTAPQYFAPPDETEHWIPLAEDNWNYASMWYTIEPSVANGLLDPDMIGTFRWAQCWPLGVCLDYLLRKISGGKVTFEQNEAGSEFLYAAANPVTQGERFEYLFTQKSNVMHPSLGGESAARCLVRLDWFLEFLRNGLNCYWWLEERSGGTYAFRVEHVEWFRRGGSYTEPLDGQIDLTQIKTRRNFQRNGEAAKRLDDQLHKYNYDLQGMTEKYTYAWQGEGGSDAFKGNPMFFKAGWLERGSSESHEVDNIFADLSWLMLNAGTETESSKNYDGIFVFSGYRRWDMMAWTENSAIAERYMMLGYGPTLTVDCDIYVTIPEGYRVTVEIVSPISQTIIVGDYLGTGVPQLIPVAVRGRFDDLSRLRVDFGTGYDAVKLHRIHTAAGNVYIVPNVENRLLEGGYLQNGPLAWPWLQCEYLHYDIPAQRWGYDSDDIDTVTWETTGTVKMRKMQDVPLLPLPTKNDEDKLMQGVAGGLRDSQGQLQTGIVKNAEINLGTRNATLTLMYDMIS